MTMTMMICKKNILKMKNRIQKLLLHLVLLIVVFSCKTPDLVLSENLNQNTTVYDVKGRQGWHFNQTIRYGGYTTSKVKRGWNLGYNFPFAISFKGAKEKLNYTQSIPSGKSANVLCIGKFSATEIPLINDFFAITLKREDYFAGSIKNETINWDFIVYEPDGNSLEGITSGLIVNQNNKAEKITIRAVKKIKGQANWINIDVNGYEFIQNDKAIGATSLLNSGRVWISNDINDEIRLVLSSVMTGLIVRHSQSESLNE